VGTPTQREHGTVKTWLPSKGFGFISLSGNAEEIFVHHSQIVAKDKNGAFVPFRGYRELTEGQKVEFEIEQCQKRSGSVGFHAVRVVASEPK